MSLERYEISDYGYGKSAVKVLHVKKEGRLHSIREFEVSTDLKLNSQRDYRFGDNRDIIATDSQKNTVYLLAKRHGISTPEEFGMLACKHFLTTYSQVSEVTVRVDSYPWERIKKNHMAHNHAFIFVPTALRSAVVVQRRHEPCKIKASLSNLRVLKTTQSSFVNFVRDEYTTLPDAQDRIFSTVIDANWWYSTTEGVDFDNVWTGVRDDILYQFAGHVENGIPSPSVQNTMYLAEKMILDTNPQISNIEMTMPNKHYFGVKFDKFPKTLTEGGAEGDVYHPVDKPSGLIRAMLRRKDYVSKL